MSLRELYSRVMAGIEVETMIWSSDARNTHSARLCRGRQMEREGERRTSRKGGMGWDGGRNEIVGDG